MLVCLSLLRKNRNSKKQKQKITATEKEFQKNRCDGGGGGSKVNDNDIYTVNPAREFNFFSSVQLHTTKPRPAIRR